jgi:hypothetical protein
MSPVFRVPGHATSRAYFSVPFQTSNQEIHKAPKRCAPRQGPGAALLPGFAGLGRCQAVEKPQPGQRPLPLRGASFSFWPWTLPPCPAAVAVRSVLSREKSTTKTVWHGLIWWSGWMDTPGLVGTHRAQESMGSRDGAGWDGMSTGFC